MGGGLIAEICAALADVLPALGRHACHVVGAYGASAIVIGALIWATLAASRRARNALDGLEEGRRRRDG